MKKDTGKSQKFSCRRFYDSKDDCCMATESFSRTFTVNPDWGIKNLEKAIDNGSPTVKRLSTPEAKAKFKEATTITPEMEARIKARYGK